MKVKPLGNRILVKQVSAEAVTKSGIVLPQSAEKNEKSQYEIVALGNGEAIAKLGLSIGQVVMAGKYSGDEVEMEGGQETKYKILFVGTEKDESDILAIIE